MSTPIASFDVFDTLITRAVGAPDSLFLLLGRLDDVARVTGCTPEQFARLRKAAEQRSRDGRRETTLARIYRELGPGLNLGDDEMQRLADSEVELERRLSRIVPAAHGLLERSRGRRKVALSDMYLPAPVVTDLLDRHGLADSFDRILVSCEHGVRKSDGGLYDVLLETERVRARDCRHVGDNAFSDVRVPRILGIEASHVAAAKLNRYEEIWESYRSHSGGFSSLVAGASRLARLRVGATEGPSPIVAVAAGVGGPILIAYLLWLLRAAEREGIRRLYFLARDGEMLYLLARRLVARLGLDIDLRYLYGARSVYHRAALADGDLRAARWAWTAMYRLTPLDVLKRLGLSDERAEATLARLDREAPMPDSATEEAVERLIGDEQVQREVRTTARQLRSRVQAYLRQEGMFDGVPRAIVDSGWAGRIVQALVDVFPDDAEPLHRGYLFGYWKREKGYRTPGTLRGYLFDEHADTGWGHAGQADGMEWTEVMYLVETFTVADHGATVDFVERDGRYEPVLASEDNPVARSWAWGAVRRTMLEFVDALVLDGDIADVGADLRGGVADVLKALWLDPTEDEARVWGAAVYEDDVLAASRNALAHPISAKDFVGKANPAYEGKRLWIAASLKLTSPGLRPAARAGLWLNGRRLSGGGLSAYLPERSRGRLRLLALAARARGARRAGTSGDGARTS